MPKLIGNVANLFPSLDKKVNIFGKSTFLSPNLIGEPRSIVLPDMYATNLTRLEIIDKFLRSGWLPEKEQEELKPWLSKMLDEFSLELLLHAKHGSIDRLLMGAKLEQRRTSKFPLCVVNSKPKKPQRMAVELEEIEGELDEQVKTIKVKDVPRYEPPCSDCD